jgi:uncharacterized protein
MSTEIRMEIKGLMLDPSTNNPIVILQEAAGERQLPIWIGVFEANAIALNLDGFQPPRPMSHDLLRTTIEVLGGEVERIVISDLRDSTFYALIHVNQAGEARSLDARPSDAIALAVRTQAPIFVAEEVLEKAHAADKAADASDEDHLKKLLEELSPDDLGKYTM